VSNRTLQGIVEADVHMDVRVVRRPPARGKYMRLAGLTVLLWSLAAAATPAHAHPPTRYPYTLVDIGTFGGPQADQGNSASLNESGVVVGTADTSVLDPFGASESGAFNGDPFVQHAYSWQRGTLTDLGALGSQPAANSSYTNAINARGHAAGLSDNGSIDPLLGTAETEAVLWRNGTISDLGTLGGHESQAFALNDRDQVVGVAANTVSDAVSMLGWGTQARAFLWQAGTMRDLGTLGGPDSFGWSVNDRGQVAGVSYTSAVPKSATGQPPIDVFLWEHGRMRDLGSLGGSVPVFDGIAGINERGEIAGQSNLAGDRTAHPFLWDGTGMIDLGTLGGDNGHASAINDRGVVAGTSDLADGTHFGFLWMNGRLHPLPPVGGAACSFASDVNARSQAVGSATTCSVVLAAVLWTHGVGVDLNTLVAPSTLHMTAASSINDAGDIIGEGVLPNGNLHNFVLIPNHHR
jgi:probable HAF family extracellular repeat protein